MKSYCVFPLASLFCLGCFTATPQERLPAPLRPWPAEVRDRLPPDTAITKEVEIKARKFEYTPNRIEVAGHTLIRFRITAEDAEHGFEIQGVKDSCVKIKKGETATVEYKAEKPGTIEFKRCKFCGMGHGRMKGSIVVKELSH